MILDDKTAELREWLINGGTVTDFATLYKVGRRTVQRCMARNGFYEDPTLGLGRSNLKNIMLTQVFLRFLEGADNTVFICPTDLVNGVPTIIIDDSVCCDDQPYLTATGWINDHKIFSGEIIGKYCFTGIDFESLDLETVLCKEEYFILIPPCDPNYLELPKLVRLECKIFGDKVVLFYVTEHEGVDENSLNYNCIGFVDDKGIFTQRVSVIKKDGLCESALGNYLR